jgi:hypothetical protein
MRCIKIPIQVIHVIRNRQNNQVKRDDYDFMSGEHDGTNLEYG